MLRFNALAQQLLDGGFTVDIAGHCPEDGYMVSPYKDHETWFYDSVQDIPEAIRTYFVHIGFYGLLEKPDHYIGGWRDGDKLYLDVSVRVTNRADAVLLCKLHNQLAYYDVAKKETVYV